MTIGPSVPRHFPIPASPSSLFLTLKRPYRLMRKNSFLMLESPYCSTRKTKMALMGKNVGASGMLGSE